MSILEIIIALVVISCLWKVMISLFKKEKNKDLFSDCFEVSGMGELVLDAGFIVQKSSIGFADHKKISTCDPGVEDKVSISHDKCKIKISWDVSGIREICFTAQGKNKCLEKEADDCNNCGQNCKTKKEKDRKESKSNKTGQKFKK